MISLRIYVFVRSGDAASFASSMKVDSKTREYATRDDATRILYIPVTADIATRFLSVIFFLFKKVSTC